MFCPADNVVDISIAQNAQRARNHTICGGLHGLLEVLDAIHAAGETAVLTIVVATEGSTYQKPGALVLLDRNGLRYGVLSGGCLEPELEAQALQALSDSRAQSADFDTRSDEDLTFGSGTGCRGRVRLILLPQPPDAPLSQALHALAGANQPLLLTLTTQGERRGTGTAKLAGDDEKDVRWRWNESGSRRAPESALPDLHTDATTLRLEPPRRVLFLGAGPETPVLLAYMSKLGWSTCVVEHRQRWLAFAKSAGAGRLLELAPDAAAQIWTHESFDAVLLMSHNFSLDQRALQICIQMPISYIGLLGPASRRDAMLGELDANEIAVLGSRLHAPVGLALGGQGPAPIALAIVAELQQHFAQKQSRQRATH